MSNKYKEKSRTPYLDKYTEDLTPRSERILKILKPMDVKEKSRRSLFPWFACTRIHLL